MVLMRLILVDMNRESTPISEEFLLNSLIESPKSVKSGKKRVGFAERADYHLNFKRTARRERFFASHRPWNSSRAVAVPSRLRRSVRS